MADNRNAEGETLLADGVERRAVLREDFGPATRHEDEDAAGAVVGGLTGSGVGAVVGGLTGAGVGAVVGGPIGAVVGGTIGALAGVTAGALEPEQDGERRG